MQRIIEILSIPGCVMIGTKVSVTLWPIDPFLAFLTAGYFFILFCDFILEAIEPRKVKP